MLLFTSWRRLWFGDFLLLQYCCAIVFVFTNAEVAPPVSHASGGAASAVHVQRVLEREMLILPLLPLLPLLPWLRILEAMLV